MEIIFWMLALIASALPTALDSSEAALPHVDDMDVLIDFRQPEMADLWYIVDDGVMGGVSAGTWAAGDDGTARFSGTLSLENNGGFSSVRVNVRADLSDYVGVWLRLRGDGQRYGLDLRDAPVGASYRYVFETQADHWQTIYVPFNALQATSFGVTLTGAPPLDNRRIVRMGFIISDKQAGSFALDVAQIGAYRSAQAPDIAQAD